MPLFSFRLFLFVLQSARMEVEAPPAYEGSLVEGGTVLQNNDNNHNGMGQQQTRGENQSYIANVFLHTP